MTSPLELPNDPGFARQVEQSEVDAWLELDQSALGARHLEFVSVDGTVLMLDHATAWPHSRILNLGIGRPASADLLQALITRAREAGIDTLMTDVSPIARPGTITRLLTQAGFAQRERHVVVARHTAGMPEPDEYFRIRRGEASDREAMTELMDEVIPGALDWCILLANQVTRPAWRYYIAMEDGAPCGLAGLHIHDEVAWLSPIWVRAAYRNRGTQAALIAHSVREAEREGVQWVITSYPATLPGRTRNFERAGFAIVYLRNRFVWSDGGS